MPLIGSLQERILYLVDLEVRRARRLETTVILLGVLGNKGGARKGYFELLDSLFPENVREREKFEVDKNKVLEQELKKTYTVVPLVNKQTGWDRLRQTKGDTSPGRTVKLGRGGDDA